VGGRGDAGGLAAAGEERRRREPVGMRRQGRWEAAVGASRRWGAHEPRKKKKNIIRRQKKKIKEKKKGVVDISLSYLLYTARRNHFAKRFLKTTPTLPEKPLHQRSQRRSPAKHTLYSFSSTPLPRRNMRECGEGKEEP
jgi:hypothetical protein